VADTKFAIHIRHERTLSNVCWCGSEHHGRSRHSLEAQLIAHDIVTNRIISCKTLRNYTVGKLKCRNTYRSILQTYVCAKSTLLLSLASSPLLELSSTSITAYQCSTRPFASAFTCTEVSTARYLGFQSTRMEQETTKAKFSMAKS